MGARMSGVHWGLVVAALLTVMAGSATPGATRAMGQQSKSAGGAAWPYVGYDQARSKYNAVEQTFTTKTIKNLKKAWNFTIPGNGGGGVGTISKGIYYDYNIDQQAVYGLDLATGKVVWSSAPFPQVHHMWPFQMDGDNSLITVTGNDTTTLGLTKLAIPGGEPRWTYATHRTIFTPIMVHGVDYITLDAYSTSSTLLALDDATGKVIWKVTIPGSLESQKDAATDGTKYYVAVEEASKSYATLRAYALADGSLTWEHRFKTKTFGAPECDGPVLSTTQPLIFEQCTDSITAIDTTTGAAVWHWDYNYLDYAHLLVYGKTLVADLHYSSSHTHHLTAYDTSTGILVWDDTLPDANVMGLAGAGNVLFHVTVPFTPTLSPYIAAYSLKTGKQVWTGKLPANPSRGIGTAPPLIGADKVLVPTTNHIVAFGLS